MKFISELESFFLDAPPVSAGTSTPPPPPPPAPVLQSVVIGAVVNQSLTADITATGAVNGDPIFWTLTPEGGGAVVAQNDTPTITWPAGTISLATGIARGNYILTVTVRDSAAVSSDPFIVDTVAPTVSGVSAVAIEDVLTWTATSDQAEGTLYTALRLATDPILSVSNILSGTGAALQTSSDTSVSADGTNTGSFVTPEDDTYRVDAVQVDDFGNTSDVVTSGDIVIASTSLTRTFLSGASDGNTGAGGTTRLDLSQAATSDQLYVIVNKTSGFGVDPAATLSLEGTQAALIGQTDVNAAASYVYKISCPAAAAGNGTASVTWQPATGGGQYHCAVWKVEGPVTTETIYSDTASSAGSPLDLSGAVGNGTVLAGGGLRGGIFATPAGLALDTTADWSGAAQWGYFSAEVSTATLRTMQLSHSDANEPSTAIAVALS